MSLEELKKTLKNLIQQPKPQPKVEKPKPKPKPKVVKLSLEEIEPPNKRPTEVYRAIYYILTGRTIRGSREKAIRAIIEVLQKELYS